MRWFGPVAASVVGFVAAVMISVACLFFVFYSFMAWLVTCTGMFAEGGCGRSENVWLNLGFAITASVLVVGAILTMILIVRSLARWASPSHQARPLGRLVTVTAGLAVTAVVLVAGGQAIADAIQGPSSWEKFNAPVIADRARCVAVPDTVVAEVTTALVTGQAIKIGGPSIDAWGGRVDYSYRLRLDRVRLSEWVAVATPMGFEPNGHWIAARVVGMHSYASDLEEDWRPLNTFDGWSMFFKGGAFESGDGVGIVWDETHDYRVRMTSLPNTAASSHIDRDSEATLAVCLGYADAPDRIGWGEPWIWQLRWHKFSENPNAP
jgi:hypothetical protein